MTQQMIALYGEVTPATEDSGGSIVIRAGRYVVVEVRGISLDVSSESVANLVADGIYKMLQHWPKYV